MIKLILKYLLLGIAAGCILFVGNIIFHDLINSEQLELFFDNFTAYAIGYIAIGIGFFGVGVIYEVERLRFSLKSVIHISVGVGTFILVGFRLGWLTLENSPNLIVNIAINVAILLAGWTALYFRDKKEIQRINMVLAERDTMMPLDTE